MTPILLGPDAAVPSALASLWPDSLPNRCLLDTALHAGPSRVDLVVDDDADPNVSLARTGFGSWSFASDPTSPFVADGLELLRRSGGVWLAWPGDAPPPPPGATGCIERLEFTDRDRDAHPCELPHGTRVEPITTAMRDRLEWGSEFDDPPPNPRPGFGDAFGMALMGAGDILCETYAPWWSADLVEIGVITPLAHRGKGYAAATCAVLADTVERLGPATTWTCNLDNEASAATARAIGYRTERPYRFWLYPPTKAAAG